MRQVPADLGGELEAYYDKDTTYGVFPAEEPAALAQLIRASDDGRNSRKGSEGKGERLVALRLIHLQQSWHRSISSLRRQPMAPLGGMPAGMTLRQHARITAAPTTPGRRSTQVHGLHTKAAQYKMIMANRC